MDRHDLRWIPTDIHGFHTCSWNPMNLHQLHFLELLEISVDFHCNLLISMDFDGFPLYFPELHLISMAIHGISMDFVDFSQLYIDFHWLLFNSKDRRGDGLISKDFHCISLPWMSMDSWKSIISVEFLRCPWTSMNIQAIAWISMEVPWTLMDFDNVNSMDFNGLPNMVMDANGFI